MNLDHLLSYGTKMLDFLVDYHRNIREKNTFPNIKPGFMSDLLPEQPPEEAEDFDNIFTDINKILMPGLTHWQSPHMHAYFPALTSVPSILGELLASSLNCICFTWASCPSGTELEIHMMDWLAKMLDLPVQFLHSSNMTSGGGTILTTCSEGTLVSMLAARKRAINEYRFRNREDSDTLSDSEINAKLVAYCSDQAHSSVEKNALISLVRLRLLPTDDESLGLRGDTLWHAIEEDIKNGLIPFYVCATLGTTGICSFDHLDEISNVCESFCIWLHVDAAYAGSAFICPEYREKWFKSRGFIDSFVFNPSKWLMVGFDCTAFWVSDATTLHSTFNVNPLYLRHEMSNSAVDFMHWQIPLSKRFRAIKLWFVLRYFGIKGLQNHIRTSVSRAEYFASLVRSDNRFEIPVTNNLGLVPFRLKGPNELTETLLSQINADGVIHMVPAKFKNIYIIRFTVTSPATTKGDIERSWYQIQKWANVLLNRLTNVIPNISYKANTKSDLKNLIEVGSEDYENAFLPESIQRSETKPVLYRLTRYKLQQTPFDGQSLLMSNVTSKDAERHIINGSFSATIDNENAIDNFINRIANLMNIQRKGNELEKVSKLRTMPVRSRTLNSRNPRLNYFRMNRLNSLDSKIDDIMEYIQSRKDEDLSKNEEKI